MTLSSSCVGVALSSPIQQWRPQHCCMLHLYRQRFIAGTRLRPRARTSSCVSPRHQGAAMSLTLHFPLAYPNVGLQTLPRYRVMRFISFAGRSSQEMLLRRPWPNSCRRCQWYCGAQPTGRAIPTKTSIRASLRCLRLRIIIDIVVALRVAAQWCTSFSLLR